MSRSCLPFRHATVGGDSCISYPLRVWPFVVTVYHLLLVGLVISTPTSLTTLFFVVDKILHVEARPGEQREGGGEERKIGTH